MERQAVSAHLRRRPRQVELQARRLRDCFFAAVNSVEPEFFGLRYASQPKEPRNTGSSCCGSGSVSSTLRQRNRRALWNGIIGACARRRLAERSSRFPGTSDSRESEENILVYGDLSPV